MKTLNSIKDTSTLKISNIQKYLKRSLKNNVRYTVVPHVTLLHASLSSTFNFPHKPRQLHLTAVVCCHLADGRGNESQRKTWLGNRTIDQAEPFFFTDEIKM